MSAIIESFCSQNKIPKPFVLTSIRSGRNSAVYKVSSEAGIWLLKHYFQTATDKRSRLFNEYNFLSFLNKADSKLVATTYGYDAQKNLALYSFLCGEKPSIIEEKHINQALEFIIILYELKNNDKANDIGNAVDACFEINHHLDLVDDRFLRFASFVNNNSIENSNFHYWVNNTLRPSWEKIKAVFLNKTQKFSKQLLTLSPSDYGFHNTLENNGKLKFVDFEYAGWDSMSKLACDFICQPELPISDKQAAFFLYKLAYEINHLGLIDDVNLLLPVHRIKWCCILLNVFCDQDLQRRVHSGSYSSGLLSKQLNMSKIYFETHLRNIIEKV